MMRLENLSVDFPVRGGGFLGRRRLLRAVDDVNLHIVRGRTLGLVGESGCGKTTLMRTMLGLQQASAGRVLFGGEDLTQLSAAALRRLRSRLQIVFQDPSSSLNPRMTIHDILAEPLRIHGRYALSRVEELLGYVGMTPEILGRLPAEFSGGQRQRIGIARALALQPELVVLDEPVSALDVSIQAQVINLLLRLQRELKLTYFFVAHDISVVGFMSDDVAVMFRGRIVEIGPKAKVLSAPAHPYTQALIAAAPVADPRGRDARSEARRRAAQPAGSFTSQGCAFRPRCPHAQAKCAAEAPPLGLQAGTHMAACWYPPPASGEN